MVERGELGAGRQELRSREVTLLNLTHALGNQRIFYFR